MQIYTRKSVVSNVQAMGRLTQGQAESAVQALETLIVEACKRGHEIHLQCGKFEKIERHGVKGIVFRQATTVKEYLNEL